MLRVTGANELKYHLHELFAGKLGAREVLEDSFSMLGIDRLALSDSGLVGVFKFNPPIRLHFCESFLGVNECQSSR
jgi:hypothetical protein